MRQQIGQPYHSKKQQKRFIALFPKSPCDLKEISVRVDDSTALVQAHGAPPAAQHGPTSSCQGDLRSSSRCAGRGRVAMKRPRRCPSADGPAWRGAKALGDAGFARRLAAVEGNDEPRA